MDEALEHFDKSAGNAGNHLEMQPIEERNPSSVAAASRVYQRQNAFLSSQPLSRGVDISSEISEAPLSQGLRTAGVGLPPKMLSPEAVPSPMPEFVASDMGRSRVYRRENAFLPSQPLSQGGDISGKISEAPLSLGRRTAGVGLPPKMLPQEAVPSPMTEFVGAGRGQGIFELPLRASSTEIGWAIGSEF